MELTPTNQIPFQQLLQAHKTIPRYQRDFVWEEGLIRSFVESLYEAFDKGSESYFSGSMVFYKESGKNTYEIVDGQQRITVIYTLISEILTSMYASEDRDTHDLAANERRRYICAVEGFSGAKYLFSHGSNDVQKCLEQIGSGEPFEQGITDNRLLINLVACRETIHSFLAEKFHDKSLEERFNFHKYILEKVKIVHFLAPNISEALLIYSRLNSGGKILGHLEIIKGQLFSGTNQYDDQRWNDLDNKWNDFWIMFNDQIKVGGYGSPKRLIVEESLLSYYFFINAPELVNTEVSSVQDGFLPRNKISEFLLKNSVKRKQFSNPEDFLENLYDFTKSIKDMRSGLDADDYCKNRLIDVAILSQTQTQPLLFLLRCKNNPDLFKVATDIAFKLVFIFTMSVTGTGSTSGAWRGLSNRVYEKAKCLEGEELVEDIKNYARGEVKRFWVGDFLPMIGGLSIDDDKAKTKKLLILLELSIRHNSGLDRGMFYNYFYYRAGFDVDHLSPKGLDPNPLNEQWINRLGNAALLDSSANRAIKDSPFSDDRKQRALKNSENFSTRSIVLDESDVEGPKNKKAVSYFSKVDDITEDTIKVREVEMLLVLEKYLLDYD